jgi:hypothetical protein
MKKILLLGFTLMMISLTISAQTFFSSYKETYTFWDEKKSEFVQYSEENVNSMFELNDTETMFTHTTPSMSSTYYIKGREFDYEKEVWTYKVLSDVGNKYIYVFDPKHNQIRAVMTINSDEVAAGKEKAVIVMVVYHLKSIFTNKK